MATGAKAWVARKARRALGTDDLAAQLAALEARLAAQAAEQRADLRARAAEHAEAIARLEPALRAAVAEALQARDAAAAAVATPVDPAAVDLGAPLSDAEAVGAYKVLAYLAPRRESLAAVLRANRQVGWFPHGVFLHLLEYPEVRETLFLKEIREASRPIRFRMKAGFTAFGHVWDRFVSMEAFRTREYEPEVQAVLARHLPAGGTAIDIGANIGLHAAFLCTLCGPTGRVLAFEPVPHIVELLRLLKQENGFGQLQVFAQALSDRPGQVAMRVHESNLGGNAVHLGGGEGTTAVDCVRLEDAVGDLDRLDLVKIDVEGFEGQALAGGWSLIERHRPAVVMEFTPGSLRGNGTDPVGLLQRFRDLGYRIGAIGGDAAPAEDLAGFVAEVEGGPVFVNLEMVAPRP